MYTLDILSKVSGRIESELVLARHYEFIAKENYLLYTHLGSDSDKAGAILFDQALEYMNISIEIRNNLKCVVEMIPSKYYFPRVRLENLAPTLA